jgi:2-keto-3-deoxy-L-rhamnonate aldolase RhmA
LGERPRRESLSPWINPVTRALREGKVCVGALSISFPSPAVAQICGQAGFRWFYIDLEHSGTTIAHIDAICTAAKLAGIVPIVGTSGITDFLTARPLDNGAMGVIVPHVSTREETELIVGACRYAPVGTRGVCGLGSAMEFEAVDLGEWVAAMNREILAAVKVESARGVENIDAIAAVPGLDAILVGPTDLTTTMGIPGQFDHPRFLEAMDRVLTACKRNHVAGGPHVGSAEAVRYWADRGATFLSCGFDGELLLQAFTTLGKQTRHLLGDRMF